MNTCVETKGAEIDNEGGVKAGDGTRHNRGTRSEQESGAASSVKCKGVGLSSAVL